MECEKIPMVSCCGGYMGLVRMHPSPEARLPYFKCPNCGRVLPAENGTRTLYECKDTTGARGGFVTTDETEALNYGHRWKGKVVEVTLVAVHERVLQDFTEFETKEVEKYKSCSGDVPCQC